MARLQTGHQNSRRPAFGEAGAETSQVGTNAVLPGYVFDPSDIPFLPIWPDMPAVYPRFESNRGDEVCAAIKFPKSEKEFPGQR